MGASRTVLSGTCRNFASHGYIVFIMDHHDESSLYIEDKNG